MLRFTKTEAPRPVASGLRSFRPLMWMAFVVFIGIIALSQVNLGPEGNGPADEDVPPMAHQTLQEPLLRMSSNDRVGQNVSSEDGASDAEDPMSPEAGATVEDTEDEASDIVGVPTWPREELDEVKDHSLSTDNSKLLFEFLGTLSEIPNSEIIRELQRQGRDFPIGYSQLYRQPAQYRGELVKIEGLALAVFPKTAPKNDFGVDRYYEIWVLAADKKNVYWLNVTELPEGFPVSPVDEADPTNYERISENISAVALFFRVGVYSGQEGYEKAPVLAARTFTWVKEPPPAESPLGGGPTLAYLPYIVGGTLLLAVIATAVVFVRSAQQAKAEHEHRLKKASVAGLDRTIEMAGTRSTEESLAELERTQPDETPPWKSMADGDGHEADPS